mmetsp:Transcript_3690/g.7736  ORF Transcript_3690/g.7736 Transcript_3690/m.7736 type:complete len:288 (-) Transcript_3690:629-1492(-)
MLLDLCQRLVPELLGDLRLRPLVSLDVGVVECILVPVCLGAALKVRQNLRVQDHVHDLLGDIPRIVVEKHLREVHPHGDILGSLGYVHHLAKRGRTRLVQEAVPGEEKGWIGRAAVADAQRGVGGDVSRGVNHGVPALIEVHLDVGLGAVVEHVAEGGDSDVGALPLLVGVGAGVDGVERPLEHLDVVFDVVAHQVYFFQDLAKVIKFDALEPAQRKDEGGKALVAEVRHGDRVVVKPRQAVKPRQVWRVLLRLKLCQQFHKKIKVRHGILTANPSELINRSRHAPV